MQITWHSKNRIKERTEGCNSLAEAKRLAKQAKQSGDTINMYQRYPKFAAYLRRKKAQTNSCSIRIYRGNIYIWRGNGILMTAHPIPQKYLDEMKEIDGNDTESVQDISAVE